MPNQYSAADLVNVPRVLAASRQEDAGQRGASDFVTEIPFDAPSRIDIRPKPSASGIGGANSIPIATAFDGGRTSSNRVVDHIDAPFKLNVKPTPPS